MAATLVNSKPEQGQISSEDYKFLQEYVYRESGIVLDGDKHYLLDARLTPVMRRAGLGTLDPPLGWTPN